MTTFLPTPRTTRRVALALAAVLALGAAGCDRLAPKPSAFNSVDITGVDYAQRLELPDVDGRPRSLAEFKGKVTVIFFGYTHCPDVCPTTMAELGQIRRQLGVDADKLAVIFVTVDPQRDDAKLLKAYVQAFDPSFVALRGTPEQVEAAARGFKVFYEKVPGKTPGDYTVNHTAGAYVLDRQGRPRLFVRYGQDPKGLEADLKALIAGA